MRTLRGPVCARRPAARDTGNVADVPSKITPGGISRDGAAVAMHMYGTADSSHRCAAVAPSLADVRSLVRYVGLAQCIYARDRGIACSARCSGRSYAHYYIFVIAARRHMRLYGLRKSAENVAVSPSDAWPPQGCAVDDMREYM